MKWMMTMMAAAAVALCVSPASADEIDWANLSTRIGAAEKRIEALEKRAGIEVKAPAAKPRGKGCGCGPLCECPDCDGSCGSKAAAPTAVLTRDPKRAICQVWCGSSGGSGTVVAAGGGRSLVVTNSHVVNDPAARLTVKHLRDDGFCYEYVATCVKSFRVVNLGPGLIDVLGPDLAILEIGYELPHVEIADAEPALGSRVTQHGFQVGTTIRTPSTKTGTICPPSLPYAKAITSSTFLPVSGDSGSGWFDDAGRLVAVCTGHDATTGHAVPVTVVHAVAATVDAPRLALFPRLRAVVERHRAKVAARDAAHAAAAAEAQGAASAAKPAPATVTAPPATGCPGGVCPSQTYVFPRGRFGR
jgi:hypothetical protein